MFALAELALPDVASSAELLLMRGGRIQQHVASGADIGRTSFLLYSVWKMITAMAVLRPVDGKQLSPATRIATVIPEFGQASKEDLTVEELLSHEGTISRRTWSYGLGLLIDDITPVSARGSWTAPGTFDHGGATANQAFYDPIADLTFVCLTNSCVS